MISSSKFDSSQIIFDRQRPLNGRLSLSYDHISPQLRRRKFKPRERGRREGAQKRTRRDAEPVFCVTHNENSSVWFFGLGTPPPSPSPQRNPFSSPPSAVSRPLMPLQTINQGRNNAETTVSYSAPPWSKKTQTCYPRTATYSAGEVTIINPCTRRGTAPKSMELQHVRNLVRPF